MNIETYKTKQFYPPQEDIEHAVLSTTSGCKENSIIVISSKIVSIHQGRTVPVSHIPNKDELIKKEAELYLERSLVPGEYVMHTYKENILVPSSGIDKSNGNAHYILWPKHPMQTATYFLERIKEKHSLENFGVIIADSTSVFLRRGVIGRAIGFAGFSPLHDYRGTKDIFGDTLTSAQINIPDALAAAAVFVMGEGNEQTPIASISNIPFVRFGENVHSSPKPYSDYFVKKQDDIYYPFIENVPWKKGGCALR